LGTKPVGTKLGFSLGGAYTLLLQVHLAQDGGEAWVAVQLA
jgi:hypothetical protein